MNYVKPLYTKCWSIGEHKFTIVNHDEDYFSHSKTIDGACKILANHLNWDCEKFADPIDEFTLNYLIVDDDKEVFTIDFRYKGDDVIIYLVSRSETIASFNMSDYIDDTDERYY